MLRPSLALLAAEAAGGRAEDGVLGAVAVELVHGFSLLHDDVMDGDRIRRHRPTAWTLFGVPMATLTGDALLALATQVLAETGRAAEYTTLVLSSTLIRLMGGQCADLDFEARTTVTVDECVQMATNKTGALLGCACALGGHLGGGNRDQVRHLQRFGDWSGLSYQFADDLLGIAGDTRVTGKPVGADLARRKKSLPVVFALSSGTAAGEELAELYDLDRPLTPEEIRRATKAVRAAGGLEWAKREANRYRTLALQELRACDLRPRPVGELERLADLMTHRDH